jgi:uncharacterized protein YfaS (alpha-2-macroglobulin family)
MRKLRKLAARIFGNIVWRPPQWARGIRLRHFIAASILLAILCSGAMYGYTWYKKLPKPRKVLLLADSIPVTRLEKELHPPNLNLHFNESAAPLELIGKKVTTGIRIEPQVEGVWRWNGDRRLIFTPAADWPANQKYRVTLDKKTVAPHVLLDRYSVDVATAPFAVHVNKLEFYQNPTDPAVKQVVATLEFTHSVAPGELEKHLALTMLGGSQVFKPNAPPFTVDYGLHHRLAYIHSAAITLPEREDFMKLALDKKMSTAQGGASMKDDLEQKVRVPDRFSFFKIDSVKGNIARRNDGEPDQLLVVNTTAETKSADIARAMEVYLLPKKAEKKTDSENAGDAPETASDDKSDSDDEDNSEEVGGPTAQWQSPREVDADVLKNAKSVIFSVVPSAEPTSKQHVFKIQVEGDGSLYLRIKKGVKAYGDFELGADYDTVLNVPQPPVEIEIQGDGGVLALSGERKLSVRSRGVPVIDYEIARVPADQINHLVSQTGGNFQNPEFLNSHFDETNIARIADEKQAINLENHFKSNYSTFDFSNYLKPATDGGSPMQGLFFIKARGWNPKTKKYLRDVIAERFILVTDTGLLVKENTDGSRDVFLQSLAARKPLAGVAVDIMARNGVPAISGVTSADGRVTFPSLGKPVREKEPVAIVARNGSDVAFIPYSRSDRKIDFSRFDVGGIESVSGAELDAFVFTERGVYRPGDEMHIAFTIKQHNWGGNLAGLPLETEVVDARGTSVQVKKLALDAGGFMEFSYQTRYESPTGDYSVNVYLVRNGKRDMLLGSAGATVKEFLPDRMKIAATLSKSGPRGWIDPKDVRTDVTLRNLYGTPATERRIEAHMVLCPARFRFDEYKDYNFFDRLRESKKDVRSETVQLGESKTNASGAAQFELNLERFSDATYEMSFYAEGFEAEGGRSVNAECSALVSALPYVVGSKQDGDSRTIKMDSDHSVEFIAIDSSLKKIAVSNLVINVVEEGYVSVLTKRDDGTYGYESVHKETVVHSEDASISSEGLKYALPTKTPGNYFLELREKKSDARVCKVDFHVAGLGKVSRSLDKSAELVVKLDREQYNADDWIEVSITAPYTGSGLITIERDKVYASQWFESGQTSTVQRIKLPAGFDGTGYVNVSFIRALDSKEIFMSPLSYGVVPFTANMEKRRIKLDLHTAKLAKPGEPLKISFKTDRPSKIVVYAVDAGILQVTGYELPNPLEFYFRKQALMVQTSQIVDLILPEFSILRSAAFGGGEGEIARHLNPFKRVTEKPVVFWSGVIDADATEREVVYNVPDYFNGTLTVMAVAVSPDAVGSAKQDATIRGPFVLTPGVPTLAAPGDQFEVGVTVANNVVGSGPDAAVTLTAEPSEHLTIVKSPAQPLVIPEGREVSATFTVRANDKLGSASLMFKASGGGQSAKLRSTLSVRPPVPMMTQVNSGNFTKPEREVAVGRVMHPEYRKLEAVVSAVPLGLAHGLDVYLKNYPNGCSEQITSGAFCRLMISDEADFGLTRAEIFAQLEKTYDVLRSRQNDRGGFGYWTAESNDGIDFISTYVMNFLIEAKAAGFTPPADVYQSGMRNLQTMVVKDPHDLNDARTLAYAIYLLTREEVVTTNYILNLHDYLEKNYPKQWQGDLTGVYLAGAWSMLKNDGEARKLINAYRMGHQDPKCRRDFYQPLGADSQYVAVIARHFPDMLKRVTASDFEAIAGPIGRGDFNTLSAAYAVIALKSYSQHLAMNPPELSITEIAKYKRETVLNSSGRLIRRVDFSETAVALRFGAKPQISGPGAYFQMIETGFDSKLPDKKIADGIEVWREIVDESGGAVSGARLGEPLTVRIKIRSLNRSQISNVAIEDLLPGGFEIVGSSLHPGTGSQGCDYVEVREDRAVFFTDIGENVKTITYQIKPCNRGEFVVPPVFAESMYDRAIKARGLSGQIRVIESK